MSSFFETYGQPVKMNYAQKRMLTDPQYLIKKQKKRLDIVNNDPEAFARMKYSKQKSRALRDRNLAWRLDREKVIQQIVETKKCTLSGRELVFEVGHPDSPSIDRKDSNKGYTKSNIQIVSSRVNIAKMDMTDEEFVKLCVDVATHHGFIK